MSKPTPQAPLPMASHIAERKVISTLLRKPHNIAQIVTMLRPEAFHNEIARVVYESIFSLVGSKSHVDEATVIDWCQKNGHSVSENQLNQIVIDSDEEGFGDHASIIRDKWVSRLFEDMYSRLRSNLASTPPHLIPGIIAEETHKIQEKIGLESSREKTHQRVFESIQLAYNRGGGVNGLLTGYHDLDKLLNGLKNELYLIAARPGMGKSIFAIQLARFYAISQGLRVLLITTEMEAEAVYGRMTASELKINYDMATGNVGEGNADMLHDVVNYAEIIKNSGLIIEEMPNATPAGIHSKFMRHLLDGSIDVVIVDHAHDMDPNKNVGGTYEKMSNIAKQLRATCRMCGVPFLVFAQLNRDNTKTGDKIPSMEHLRGSGDLEQVAYAIIFLHRDEYYTKEMSEYPNEMWAILEKHRNGRTGKAVLAYDGETFTISNTIRLNFGR